MTLDRAYAKECVGEGWSALVDEVYDRLPQDAVVLNVKEKFGGLRIYVDGVSMEVLDFIDDIEDKSLDTCEICGAAGKPRPTKWIKTYCDKHYQQERERSLKEDV